MAACLSGAARLLTCLLAAGVTAAQELHSKADVYQIRCGGLVEPLEPPLFGHMVRDEAHFNCAPGYELYGQRIVTCHGEQGWDHKLPVCRELQKTTLKMKCPFDHRVWTLKNLDKISSWISQNEDNVLILDRKFVENTTDSLRLAAGMLERMNDPYFRFFGKLATSDKLNLSRAELVARFQESADFRRLVKRMRDEDRDFNFVDVDGNGDDEALMRYYGMHYLDVLNDRVVPYAEVIPVLSDHGAEAADALDALESLAGEVGHQNYPENNDAAETTTDSLSDTTTSSSTTVAAIGTTTLNADGYELTTPSVGSTRAPVLANVEALGASLTHIDDQGSEGDASTSTWPTRDATSALRYVTDGRDEGDNDASPSNVATATNDWQAADELTTVRSPRKARARGDIEKILPSRNSQTDYFGRPLQQVLQGHKAQLQDQSLRTAYLSYLLHAINHILKYNVPRPDWPPFLQGSDHNDLKRILMEEGISTPYIEDTRPLPPPLPPRQPPSSMCRPPSEYGYEMVRDGTALLSPGDPNRLDVRCNPGFVLRGASVMYCERGVWQPAGGQSPVCVSAAAAAGSRPGDPFDPSAPSDGLGDDDSNDGDDGSPDDGSPGDRPRDPFSPEGDGGSPLRALSCSMDRAEALLRSSGGAAHAVQVGGDRLRVDCAPGHVLRGSPVLFCDRGRWMPMSGYGMPMCVADSGHHQQQRPPPTPGDNYPASTPGAGYPEDGVEGGFDPASIVEANDPYARLLAAASRNVTACLRSPAPPPPPNGRVTEAYPLLDGRTVVVRFMCNPGYGLIGADAARCIDGRWQPPAGSRPPVCVAGYPDNIIDDSAMPSQPTRCGPPLRVPGGVIHYHENDSGHSYGRVTCLPGYALQGPSRVPCGDSAGGSGRWMEPMPRCVDRRQNDYYYQQQQQRQRQPASPAPNTPHSAANQPSSNSSGAPQPWSGGNHACAPLSAPDNGQLVYVTPTAVRFVCNAGYRIDASDGSRDQTTCQDGRWRDPVPRCVPDIEGGCDPSEPIRTSNALVFAYSDGRWFECMPGYTLNGGSGGAAAGGQAQMCRPGGRWDDQPTCVLDARVAAAGQPVTSNATRVFDVVDCPVPLAPAGLSVISRGKIVYYRCRDRESQLVAAGPGGTADRNECVQGRWLHSPPTCVRSGGSGYQPTAASSYPARQPYPSSQQTPDSMRSIAGSRQRRCAPPRPIAGGDAFVYGEGRAVFYQCHDGYVLRGPTVQHCEMSRWSEPYPPRCVPAHGGGSSGDWPPAEGAIVDGPNGRCPPPTIYPFASSRLSDAGLTVTYRCARGGMSSFERRCSPAAGAWHGSEPRCDDDVRDGGSGRDDSPSHQVGHGDAHHGDTGGGSQPMLPIKDSVCEPVDVINGRFFQYRDVAGYVQCDRGASLEGRRGERHSIAYCDPASGRWDVVGPSAVVRCLPDGWLDQADNRPQLDASGGDDDASGLRSFQIDSCGPPEMSSNYTWYILRDGHQVALGCKQRSDRRAVGTMSCHAGAWGYSSGSGRDLCGAGGDDSPDAGASGVKTGDEAHSCSSLEDRSLTNGDHFVYEGGVVVFQCHFGYRLIGQPMAVCSGRGTQQHGTDAASTSLLPIVDDNFVLPRCEPMDSDADDVRPAAHDDGHDGDDDSTDQSAYDDGDDDRCPWPRELFDAQPSEFFVARGGREIHFVCDNQRHTVLCDQDEWVPVGSVDLSCLRNSRRLQRTDVCTTLPDEPQHGTYFLYQDPQSGAGNIYFQCDSGYALRGQRVLSCDDASRSSAALPVCEMDRDPMSTTLPKRPNPRPTNVLRCPAPPERVEAAYVVVSGGGDTVLVYCRPGYVISDESGGEVRSAAVHCQGDRWSRGWPVGCRRRDSSPPYRDQTVPLRYRGDTSQFHSDGARLDPFGRPLPQILTGEKAALQRSQLQQQYLNHTRQLAEFRRRQNQMMRERGVSSAYSPQRPELPFVPGLSADDRRELENIYGELYNEGQRTLENSIVASGVLSRRRRKNPSIPEEGKEAAAAAAVELSIPPALKAFENDIRTNHLSQEDVNLLAVLGDPLRTKFMEDRQRNNRKSKDDPVQSQNFLSQVLGNKQSSKPPVKDVVVALKKHETKADEPSKQTAETTEPSTATTTFDGKIIEKIFERARAVTKLVTSALTEAPQLLESTTLSVANRKRHVGVNDEDLSKDASFSQTSEIDKDENAEEENQQNKRKEDDAQDKENEVNADDEEKTGGEDKYGASIDTVTISSAAVAGSESTTIAAGTDADDGNTLLAQTQTTAEEAADTAATNGKVTILKKKKKKGFDTSCAHMEKEAPEIDNGFILSYELLEDSDSQMLRVKYRCDPDFRFEYEHTSSLLCRQGRWIGEAPRCIPDENEIPEDLEEY